MAQQLETAGRRGGPKDETGKEAMLKKNLDEVLNFCGSQSLKGMFESSKMDSVGPDNHVSNELQFKSIFDLFDFERRDESHLATVYRNYINFKIDQIEKDPSTNKEIACDFAKIELL